MTFLLNLAGPEPMSQNNTAVRPGGRSKTRGNTMGSVTADEARKLLEQGNQRFQKGLSENPRRDDTRRRAIAGGQNPFAIILCCSDSRVSPEIAFDTGLGDLFVVRVAGNVANTSTIGSIEYAVSKLGAKLVVVTGHESCGAVNALMETDQVGDQVEVSDSSLNNQAHLLSHTQPALESSEVQKADAIARSHSRLTVRQICDRSEIIRKAVDSEGVKILSAFQSLASGVVDFD